MLLRNCTKCGRLFLHPLNPICKECKREEDISFQSVVDYLKENKDATMTEVASRTGVSIKEITRYFKDGRLASLQIETSIHIYCERCSTPIMAGRFCNLCNYKMRKEIESVIEKEEEPEDCTPKREGRKDKMYTINSIKRRKKRDR